MKSNSETSLIQKIANEIARFHRTQNNTSSFTKRRKFARPKSG